MSTCGKLGKERRGFGSRSRPPWNAAHLCLAYSPPHQQHVRQEEGQEFEDNMDQLLKDVRPELQRDEGGVGCEGGTQGETSLCRSCLRPTGQIASRKNMRQL